MGVTGQIFRVWDGIRPMRARDLVARHEVQVGALGVVAATETLANPADWAFEEPDHTIVVHLDGRLDRMDCEFSVGPSGSALPSPGDIWMIPAACRYAALAQGDRAEFVEFRVPTALVADMPLAAAVRHRDEVIFEAASRLSELVRGPCGDLADMASAAIASTLERHLRARYGQRELRVARRGLSASDRARLADAIKSQLDAPHSLDGLAALVGMDARRFTGAFREAFGLSPWQYVLRARLDAAARLLRQGEEPVTDIALETGFATPSHFATAFTRRFGAPPSRWRAAAR